MRLKVYYFLLLCVTLSLLKCKKESIDADKFPSTVEVKKFHSSLQNSEYSYHIYKWKDSLEQNQPVVIYLLHGHGGSDDDWFSRDEGHVRSILDSLISNETVPPLTAVSLDASNSWYVNRDTAMESVYLDEFIPFIEQQYLKVSGNTIRILAGNSAGGFGALRFGLKYPELFRDVILLSPAAYFPVPPENSSSRKIDVFKMNGVFNDSLWQSFGYRPILKSNASATLYPEFYISSGRDDNYGIAEVVQQLKQVLDSAEIKNSLSLINGGHDWDVWQNRFKFDLARLFNKSE